MEKKRIKRKKQTCSESNYIDNASFLKEIIAYKEDLKLHTGPGKAQMRDSLAEYFIKLSENLATKGNFINYCVDIETQALTRRGWLKYNEITKNDVILSLDINTKKLVWSPIRNLYVNNYDGLMFHLIGKTMDALVTPGHKFLTEMGLLPIEDIGTKEHFITMGDFVDTNNEEYYSNSFVELVGWFVTEGHIEKYYRKKDKCESNYLSFSQKRGTERHNRIIECLMNFKINEWKEYEKTNNNGVSSFRLYGDLSNDIYDVAPNKILDIDFILKLSQSQRLLLIKTMLDGDGSGCQYFQKDDDHINSFLYLCTLAEISTHARKKKIITGFGESEYWCITLSNKKSCYSEKVNFHGARRHHGGEWNRKNNPTIPYNGIVWCPQTDYGTFVCRRGSRIFVTGNSYKDEMISDAIENCIQYASNFNPEKSNNPFSYFTQMIYYAFVRRIKKEKKQAYIRYKEFAASELSESDEILTLISNNDNLKEYKAEFVHNYEENLDKKKKEISNKKKDKDAVYEDIPIDVFLEDIDDEC